MKLSLRMRIHSKIELMRILLNHLNNRWDITKDKIITFLLTTAILLSVPIISDTIFSDDSTESLLVIICCFSLEAVIFFLGYCSFKKDKITKIGKEVQYGTRTFNFIISSYNNIMDRCKLFIPQYKYFFQPMRRLEDLDLIVANIVLIKIYELYFKNIDKYGPSTVRYIPATVVSNLVNHKEFKEFYSVLFFDPKLKGKKTHYDALVVHVLDAVVNELYGKEWFADYYDANKIDTIINNILEQWSYLAIQYNLNIDDYFIKK